MQAQSITLKRDSLLRILSLLIRPNLGGVGAVLALAAGLSLGSAGLWSQETSPATRQNEVQAEVPNEEPGEVQNEAQKNAFTQPLKRNFISIELGQTVAEFRQQVSHSGQKDGVLPESYYYFLYDAFFSEIEEGGKQETLLEVRGNGFVDKGLFQFAVQDKQSEPKLVAITIFFDPKWNSYDQLLRKFTHDYGNPKELNPQRSIWQNEQTMLTLEQNLQYKIIDKKYLDSLRAEEQKKFDLYQYNYTEFLQKF